MARSSDNPRSNSSNAPTARSESQSAASGSRDETPTPQGADYEESKKVGRSPSLNTSAHNLQDSENKSSREENVGVNSNLNAVTPSNGEKSSERSSYAKAPSANRSGEKTIKVPEIKTLSELNAFTDSDCFVQLISKEKLRTKDGKPYFKVSFRDRKRTVQAIIWNDNQLFVDCDTSWRIGKFYKIRASIRDTNFGLKLEIRRIRETTPADEEDGFTPNKCRPSSEKSPETTAAEIMTLASVHLGKTPLLRLVQKIFKENRIALYDAPASRSHHRVYIGGLLEHTLSVTKIAIFLADHFYANNPLLKDRFSKELVVAGAILHDVGKILDTVTTVTGPKHTLAGDLVGHAVLGTEIVRKYATEVGLDEETRIQLEHLILTHSRFADWGAPFPPSTLEAMVLHYADYADSTFANSLNLLETDEGSGAYTLRKGAFGVPIFKPLRPSTKGKSAPKTGETPNPNEDAASSEPSVSPRPKNHN